MIIIIGILLINLIELYSIIKIILKSKKTGKLTEYIHKIINTVYWKPLESIEVEIMKIPGIDKVLQHIEKSLLYMLKDKKSVISILLLYTILPHTLMRISLCIDIIYYHKMAVLYKVLFIVVYTLTFNVIIGMVKHCCTAKKEELETESLLVTYEDNQFVMENRLKSKSNEEFQGNIEAWLLYYNILDVIGAIELAKQH
jgi:predicted KAP-like P-loop ATPase